MTLKKVFSTLVLTLLVVGVFARDPIPKVKIVDIDNVTAVVSQVTSSSSSSCMSADFPVYQGSAMTEVNFKDLEKIIVRHDKPAEDNTNYLTVELVTKSGKSDLFEMIRHIRIIGKTETGDFSVKIQDVKTVEILD